MRCIMFQSQTAVHDMLLDMNARQAQSDWKVSNIEEDLRRLQVTFTIWNIKHFHDDYDKDE